MQAMPVSMGAGGHWSDRANELTRSGRTAKKQSWTTVRARERAWQTFWMAGGRGDSRQRGPSSRVAEGVSDERRGWLRR